MGIAEWLDSPRWDRLLSILFGAALISVAGVDIFIRWIRAKVVSRGSEVQ